MSEFNLTQHIRGILAGSSEENLDELTDLVFRATWKRDHAEAYRQALPDAIRHQLASHPRADTNTGGKGQMETDAQDCYTLPAGNDPQDTVGPEALIRPNLRNSRAALLRRNRFRLSVWLGNKTYRNILECTAADLEFAAGESDRQATANAQQAERYRRLVKAMREANAETVNALTDEQITEALA